MQQEKKEHKWCKCFFEPEAPGSQNYYFMHFDTRETRWDEPTEPYWIWDALLQNVHPSGLQYPSVQQQVPESPGLSTSGPDEEYQGYNPKIHGNYDPNAPYAKYHEQGPGHEDTVLDQTSVTLPPHAAATDYAAVGSFNRFSGGFQTTDKSAERHNDYNKSGRQMNAFFDVDAAANAHGGRSLKDERRQQKLTKKEIQELTKKRREKKEKKRLDFYRS